MKLFLAKRGMPSSGMVTMVLMCAATLGKCEQLMREFNADETIRDGGGCPIEMDPSNKDWSWHYVGNAFDAEPEPRIMHYQYQY